MRLFDLGGAAHYCGQALNATLLGGAPPTPLKTFHAALPLVTTMLVEGTAEFEHHRNNALHEIERDVFFGASNYVRAFDLLLASAAPWSHVTLYYASFLSARAILGMFGAWVGYGRVVEVATTRPRAQELNLRNRAWIKLNTVVTGSHQQFWDFFYQGVAALRPYVPPTLHQALTPVSNDRKWQITARNDVNYDPATALDAAARFRRTFNPRSVRKTLAGPLATQFAVSEAMVVLAHKFATDFGLNPGALGALGVAGSRRDLIRALIQNVPKRKLLRQSRIATLTA